MPLQKQVDLYRAQGVPGDKATPDQSVYAPVNPLAAVALPVGRFVFPVVSSGTIDNTQATNVAGDASEVLGFVERVITYVNYDVFSDGTLVVPEGAGLTVAVRGDYWATSTTAATVGQKVLASTADGSISTGTPDATHLDTGWVVKTPGGIGEPIIISNWGPVVAAGSGADTSNLMQKDFSNATGALSVEHGGTGATSATAAATALGVKAMGLKDTINLTTDVTGALPVANGGTGATTAEQARTNLGAAAAE